MQFTALSYNLLVGGRDGEDDRRERAQIELVNELKPDVLFVQEAKGFDDKGGRRLYEWERFTGMRGFLALALHSGQHVAIFVRAPLRAVGFETDTEHFHHALAKLTVALPDSDQEVILLSTHLCPNGPAIRRCEAAYLASYASPDRLMLLGGDFNSGSPHDPEPPDWKRLAPHHRARHFSGDVERFDCSALAHLDAAGWVDIGHRLDKAKTPTVPTPAYRHGEFPTMRCDYLLASMALARKAVAYEVVRNAITESASDHYPVLATFDL